MDPSHGKFTNFFNLDSPNQYFESSQISPPTPQSRFSYTSPNPQQNMNPFDPPGSHPSHGHSPPSVPQQRNWVQPSPPSFHGFHLQEGPSPSPTFHFTAAANRSSSVLHFGHLAGATTNTSSHQFESSSPFPATQHENDPVNIEESSDSNEEGPKRHTRINWTEEENLRLLSCWLHHSTYPVIGIDRKAEYYWKAVAQEFNDNMPANGHKRSVKQLKTHWGDVKRDLTKFCGVYDDMAMEKAHAMYRKENKDKPFTLEYMWRVVKDLPNWRRVAREDITTKRSKISESGAYTSSSNQDTEEETVRMEKRPEGQKKAKARLKGKGPALPPSCNQPSQNIVLYHEAMSIKAAALTKSAKEKK
ncbi:hypothetical protein BS78_04G221200 [Paspalum vaginatum]|nr:hypothetical protein BS78_04G221200 [Paspalum vaginatum]